MPLSRDDFEDIWQDRTGSLNGFDSAYEMFSTASFDFGALARETDEVNAFEGFIDAFPPEEGNPRTKEEADEARQEWGDEWGVDIDDMDWDAYRDMVHEMDPDTPL